MAITWKRVFFVVSYALCCAADLDGVEVCDSEIGCNSSDVKGAALLQRRSQAAMAVLAVEDQTTEARREAAANGRVRSSAMVRTRVMPEAWKYDRDAGTCHTRHEALHLWQCREFCSLLHDFRIDCEVLTQDGAHCCEFIPSSTARESKFSAELSLPGEVLTKERAGDVAKRFIAQELQLHLGFPILVAVQATQSAYCAVDGGSLGIQDSVDACEEVAEQKGLEAWAYGRGDREGDCLRVENSTGGGCASGLGAEGYVFYRLQKFPAPKEIGEKPQKLPAPEETGGCDWEAHAGKWSPEGAFDVYATSYPEEQGKAECVSLPGLCSFITCKDGSCYPRLHLDDSGTLPVLEDDAYATTYIPTAGCFAPPGSGLEVEFGSSTLGTTCSEAYTFNGADYRGCQTMTRSGLTCQAWSAQTPHSHSRTPEKYPDAGLEDGNYCRNPDGEPSIWCYTVESTRWSYCDPLPVDPSQALLPVVPEATCSEALTSDGADYRGCQTKTRSGMTCQAWLSQTPHSHSRTPSNYPGAGLEKGNYCRNPDGETTIWCYTVETTRWEYCDPLPVDPSEVPVPVQEEVYGAWVPHHYEDGQDSNWCRTVGTFNNWQYDFSYSGPPSCGAWCCKRAVMMRNVADKLTWVTLMTSLQAGENNTAELKVSVVTQKSEVAHELQLFAARLRKYEAMTVAGLLYEYGLTSEEEAKDECKHVTDACECAFKEGCAWADEHCAKKPEEPACRFEEITGSFQGSVYNNEVFARDMAEHACISRSDCRGITCLDGQRCMLNKEGTVHPPINVSKGLLFEVFEGDGKTVQDLKDLVAFANNVPLEIALFTGEGDWPHKNNGGIRFSGSFVPEMTAVHHFWVTARESSELWMNGTKLAECTQARGGDSIGEVEQHGQLALTKDVPVKFELLYKGGGAWWANHVHLYYAVQTSEAIIDSYAPKAWNVKVEGLDRCLDTYGGGGHNSRVGVWHCSQWNSNQRFAVTAETVNGITKYIVKTTRGWCFSPEDGMFRVRACDGGGAPMTVTVDDRGKAKIVVGEKQLCCLVRGICAVKEMADTCDNQNSFINGEDLPGGAGLDPIPVPMSRFRPDVHPVVAAKDCRALLSASCSDCERQPGCPTSDLQTALDTWCYKNKRYPLARKYLGEWRCYSDAPGIGLDFKLNGVCVDSCGYPVLCPGGVNGPYESSTDGINEVLLLNEQDPCADPQSHEGQDLDAIYGSLVFGEREAAHPPILASSLQEYLDDLCTSLLGTDSVARSLENITSETREWACVRVGSGGTQQGMCISDCGFDVACDDSTFTEVLASRPRLLLEAAHDGLRHFCKSELSYVSESDVLVTFNLARLEGTELESDPESAATIEEIIMDAFAEKTLVEPQTLSISLGLGMGNCIKFRGTKDCDPNGEPDPALDQACDEPVLQESSGFCECLHGLRAAKSNCTHEEFVCLDECDRLLGKDTQVSTTTGEPKKPIHFRTYQAEDAQLFGPTGLAYQESCPKDDDVCLEQSPAWGAGYTCAGSTEWCESWAKDMQRCCPVSCGTGALTEEQCNSLSSKGGCMYPNGAQCAVDGDAPCTWVRHERVYSSGYANGGTKKSLEEAKADCVAAGFAKCKAVTCNRKGKCTARRSTTLRDSGREHTFVPSAANCFPPPVDDPPPILSGHMYKGYTGSGFVAMGGLVGRAIQWTVSVEEAGKYVVFFRYSYAATQDWQRRKRMHLRVNGVQVTDNERLSLWVTATDTWSEWVKVPFVTTLKAGSNTVTLIRDSSYSDALGPHVDSLSVATFPGASEWQCLCHNRCVPARLTDDGQVEVVTEEGSDEDADWTDLDTCAQSLVSPLADRGSLTCGYDHKVKHGWWQWGFESMNKWCWQFRRRLFAHATTESDLEGTNVRVVMHTLNPSEAFDRMRKVQTMYGDQVLAPAIEQDLQALPTIAAFSSGDVVVTDLLARQGTKTTEPKLVRTAVQDAYWNNTGASIHWPCGISCEEPEGRYMKAWGIGPLPVPGGEFFYGEKHYHHTKDIEQLKWVLHSPLDPTEEWSFHMRVMLENDGNKRGSFLLWSPDGTENSIEFDINSDVASDKLFGKDSGPSRRRTPAVYISGKDFWSPPNFRTSKNMKKKEWHDVSVLKRDCTVFVYVDGVEALANIPQYWKIAAVGFNPQRSNFRIQTLGMTGRNPAETVSPFCKMYLDKTIGFRVMRKGQSGCLKVTGRRSPVVATMNMKECTYFYYSTEDSTMRDASTGECLDWFRSQKTYGLYHCHAGSNQRFGPYREVDGKYQFMRFCLGHYDCLDELDFEICPKLQTACECAEYPKICGWNSAANVCSSEKKEEGVNCTACDRQPKCAAEKFGRMQKLADAWCVASTEFQYARLLYRDHYMTQRWACFSQAGLPNDRDGMCMDTCGYPVECAAGPMPHDAESKDVHEKMLEEVLWPNMMNTSICSDPYRYSEETCPHLGWGPGKGRSEVCSSARGLLNKAPCGGNRTFGEAEAECRGMGARLCTKTELAHDEALMAGCGLERSHVWAKRSDCADSENLAMPGSAAFMHFVPPRCLGPQGTAAVVCCADTEKPYVHIHPTDLAARAPVTPKTIPEAVWAVYYEVGDDRSCLRLSGGVLLAVGCGNPSLFASKDGQLHPWEESRATPLRTHLCLEVAATGESMVAKQCTLGAGSRLTLTDSGRLMVDDAGSTASKCITFDGDGTRSMNGIVLREEAECTTWKFTLKQRVAVPNVPLAVKELVEQGGFDDDVNLKVVQASITQVKDEVGDQVSEAFWLWVADVPGLQQSLASTSFPIHVGTVVNLYSLWSYFGEDWFDTMTSLALALAYKGRDRNIMDNEVVAGFGMGIHKACDCEPPECPFPVHRGHKPKAAAFMEYYLERDYAGAATDLWPFAGTTGAPWALMTEWQVVPIEECQFHNNNGYSPGEYTFRYGKHEIMCKHSDWHASSGPRIAEDGGVCGRLSYLSSVSHTCSATSPSRQIGQPGHAAGFRYVNTSDGAGYRQGFFWAIYDERVSSTAWTMALTENLWGQHSSQGHAHKGIGTNTQWHKTIPVSLSMEDGVNRFEKARIAAMVALQTSYWHDVEATAWMERALEYDPYSIEVWEWFRVRIEQGKMDGTQTSNLWGQFKKVMVEDATISFHALVERFFFAVVDTRACDAERLAWQVQETDAIFEFFSGKPAGFVNFDIEASKAIFLIKQMECAVVLDGWTKFMEDATYGKLMVDLMDEVIGSESLNLEKWPYGSGKKGVLAVVERCLEHSVDASEKKKAVDWVEGYVRVGEIMWDLFGREYFHWIQYERITTLSDPLIPWLLKTLEKNGEMKRLAEFEEWQESCLSKPWKHTHMKATNGAVFDGCYAGKNGVIQEVHKFFKWFIPFHESHGKVDSCFPDWALEKLRQKGVALLQNATAANGTHSGDGYDECLQEMHAGRTQLSDLSSFCRDFVKTLVTDDTSGRSRAEESMYLRAGEASAAGDDDGDSGAEGWVAEALEELPEWLQNKFKEAGAAF